MHRVADCIRDGVWLAIPEPTEWQRIGNQIDAAIIFTWADFVNVHRWQRRKLVFQSQARFSGFDHQAGCLEPCRQNRKPCAWSHIGTRSLRIVKLFVADVVMRAMQDVETVRR